MNLLQRANLARSGGAIECRGVGDRLEVPLQGSLIHLQSLAFSTLHQAIVARLGSSVNHIKQFMAPKDLYAIACGRTSGK